MEHFVHAVNESKISILGVFITATIGFISKITSNDLAAYATVLAAVVTSVYTINKWIVEYKQRRKSKHKLK